MRKIVAFFAKIISREIMHQRLAGEQTAATFHNEESPPVALTEGLLLKSGGYPTLALAVSISARTCAGLIQTECCTLP